MYSNKTVSGYVNIALHGNKSNLNITCFAELGRKSCVDTNIHRGKVRKHKPPSQWEKKGEAKEGTTKTLP